MLTKDDWNSIGGDIWEHNVTQEQIVKEGKGRYKGSFRIGYHYLSFIDAAKDHAKIYGGY